MQGTIPPQHVWGHVIWAGMGMQSK